MDGVVWVLAQAPGAFTMLGLLERQTVLMHAAQDADQHDKASISFKELVQLYLVIRTSRFRFLVATMISWR